MRSRLVLQPTITMTQSTIQEARFARRVGHGKSGVVFVNVYRHSAGAGPVTFGIETASETGVRADVPVAGDTFWKTVVSGTNSIAAGVTGAVRFKLADLGEFIRYDITFPAPTGSLDFDIVVYLADT